MSVINRMLSDLERRGAPTPQAGNQGMQASAPPRRRPAASSRTWLALLALGLVLLAAALWFQRGERIIAALQPADEPELEVPELVGLSFDRTDEHYRLALRVSDAMGRSPRYSRSGGTATLLLDADAGDLVLPAPPRDQPIFRGISLDSDDPGKSRLRLDVAPDAHLRLHVDGPVIALIGRMPKAEQTTAADSAPAASEGVDAGPAESPTEDSGEGTNAAVDVAGATSGTQAQSSGAAAAAAATTTAGTNAGEERVADGERETAPAASDDKPDGTARAAGESSPKDATTEADAGEPADSDRTDAAVETQAEGTVQKSASGSPQTRARRRYREGRDAIAGGELAAARRALTEALELDPSLHAARELLVSLLRRAGETAAARRLLAGGVERAPARLQFAMPYARMLVDTGDLDRAARVLETARTSGTGAASYHALLAAVEQRRGAHRAAAGEYTRALEIRPGNGHWWLGLGISLAALDKPAEARAAFREARTSGTLSESLDRWARNRIEQLGTGNEG